MDQGSRPTPRYAQASPQAGLGFTAAASGGKGFSLRAHTWASTQATGAKLWVASWGANDGSLTEPDLGGAYPDWAVQQYTSRGSVGGVTTDLDYAKAGAFDPAGGGGGTSKLPKTTGC